MSNQPALQSFLCPRCTAPMAPSEQACRRCGQAVARAADGRLVAVGTVCPRCNRPVRPGQSYVTATGASIAGTCAHCGSPLELAPVEDVAAFYEERAESCAPFDLERLARAEAVDGWTLLDTTLDPARPGRILVHFRRPARNVPPEVIRAAQARQAAARAAAQGPEIVGTVATRQDAAGPAVPRQAPAFKPSPAIGRSPAACPSPASGPASLPQAARPGLPWSLPLETAAAAAGPLLAEWRTGRIHSMGDLIVALLSLAMATAVYAAVFGIALAAVILSRLFRSAGFVALVVILPALLAIVLGALRVMSGSGRSQRRARRAARRHRHVAWHRP